MLRLKKTKSTEWMGNGMGTDTAEWAVVGHENIVLYKLGMDWWAVDLGQKIPRKIADARTRKRLLEILAYKRPELAV